MAYSRLSDGRSPTRSSYLPFRHSLSTKYMLNCLVGLALIVSLWIVYATGTLQDVMSRVHFPSSSDPAPPPPPPSQQHRPPPVVDENDSTRPTDVSQVRVVGLVFFGRREMVKILDCYLRRNLRVNGGLLDEVVFAVNTDDEDDLAYLDQLVPTVPQYRRHQGSAENPPYIGCWEPVDDPDAIYVKIDDDVVYIGDNAIHAVVTRLLENPRYLAVSANVVNNPALSWVHYSMGAYEPFWPEIEAPHPSPEFDWRPSTLPSYDGPAAGPIGFRKDGSTPAPFKGHRWLPVRQKEHYDLTMSPASTLTYDAFGPSLYNWAAGAQTHYSFLTHLEKDELWRYKFDVWDYNYARLSINFFALRGRDVMDHFPFPQEDDEDFLTVILPRALGRHVVVDGMGIAVHFAFRPQYAPHENHAITWTDALNRYKGYADEMICPPTAEPIDWTHNLDKGRAKGHGKGAGMSHAP